MIPPQINGHGPRKNVSSPDAGFEVQLLNCHDVSFQKIVAVAITAKTTKLKTSAGMTQNFLQWRWVRNGVG